jgi:alpha-L-arabinofuranosidase/arylsulfatase A-like enzyme
MTKTFRRFVPKTMAWIITGMCFACLNSITTVTFAQDSAKRPNVLFIAIDDLRPELGCYGADHIKSPNIDKLALQGILFNRAYCQAPHCGPSRASLLTGVHTRNHGLVMSPKEISPGALTLPGAFRQDGYTTVGNGKIFHQREQAAEQSWSEPPFSLVNGKEDNNHLTYHDKASANFILAKNKRGPFYETPDVPDNTYIDGQTCDRTIKDMQRLANMDKPFFLACGFVRPHLPFYAPKKYWDLYDRDNIEIAPNRYRPKNAPKPLRGSGEFGSYHDRDIKYNSADFHGTARHGYYACVSYADALVGRLLAELDRLALADNTIVVIWGDHGWSLGEHNFWSKHTLLHTSTHAPLIISAPGFRRNVKTDGIVEFIDIYPTLCELTGIEQPKHLEGKSMVPLMREPKQLGKRAAFTKWRDGLVVTTRDYTYTEYGEEERMLFDRRTDPQENENVAEAPEYQETVKQLSKLLAEGQEAGQPPKNQATVVIDTDVIAKPYNPMIFGGFLEHFGRQVYGGVFEPGSPLADEHGFRRDVAAALRELKMPVVRWPGGCYVSGYHWEAGVGGDRQPTDDMAWGVVESHAFGTDEFVQLCGALGWTPYICNNAGNGTVEDMKNWVEYCNSITGPYAQVRRDNGHAHTLNVPIWSIGNENWGRHEIGYKPIEQWAPLVRDAARAMKGVDPTIQLSAAAQPSREWTLPLLKAAGSYLDYISIHAYWLPLWQNNDMPDYLTCIMHSQGPEETIERFVGVLDESGYRGRIKIAFDEWNLRGWHHPGFPRKTVQDYTDPEVIELVKAREKNDIASQYTMADALFSASFLNACLRHAQDVGMANIAPIVNTRGPLFVHPKGIVKRTHFHTMAMYANLLQERVGSVSVTADKLVHGSDSVAVVDAVATVDGWGKHWAIALVNRHPAQDVACTLKLGKMPLDGHFKATVLSGTSPDAYNDIDFPNRVVPTKLELTFNNGVVDLPPHSLTVVHVPLIQHSQKGSL